jgi:hypothetical protein
MAQLQERDNLPGSLQIQDTYAVSANPNLRRVEKWRRIRDYLKPNYLNDRPHYLGYGLYNCSTTTMSTTKAVNYRASIFRVEARTSKLTV